MKREPKPYFVYTPLGPAEVWYTKASNAEEKTCLFGVFQCETKEFWLWPNHQIRICESITAMRDENHSPIHLTVEQIGMLTPHIKRHTQSPFYWRVLEELKQGEQTIPTEAKTLVGACVGGPWDGKRYANVGFQFPVFENPIYKHDGKVSKIIGHYTWLDTLQRWEWVPE